MISKSKEMGVALIGYGYWGPNVARNLEALPSFRLRHIVDIDDQRIQVAALAYPNAKVHSDLACALSDAGVEVVVVATPPTTHHVIAIRSLEAGKHVLVEKPISSRKDEASELIQLACEKGLKLGVDHTFLFSPAVQWLGRSFSRGDFGEALYFHSERLNLGLIQEGASVVWDLAPHDLSILLHVIGEKPISVSMSGGRFFNQSVPEVASVSLRFRSGMVATINVSWLSPIKVRKTIIGGSKKMAVYDDMEPTEKVKIYDRGVDLDLSCETAFSPVYRSGDVFSPALNGDEPLRAELNSFYDSIISGHAFVSDGQLGKDIVAILEACDSSYQRQQQVDVNYE